MQNLFYLWAEPGKMYSSKSWTCDLQVDMPVSHGIRFADNLVPKWENSHGLRRMILRRALSEEVCTQFTIWGTESLEDKISCHTWVLPTQLSIPISALPLDPQLRDWDPTTRLVAGVKSQSRSHLSLIGHWSPFFGLEVGSKEHCFASKLRGLIALCVPTRPLVAH